MNQGFWITLQPLLAQGARDLLRTIGVYLLAKGIILNDAGVTAFIGAGMTLLGILWGWWTTSGYMVADRLLKKLTAKHTSAAAVTTAQTLPTGAAVTKALAIFAVLLASLIFALPAMAQSARIGGSAPLPKPRPAAAATTAPANAAPAKLTSAAVQQNPFALLQQFSASDLTAALADANAQTPPDTTSAQCYTALLALVNSPLNSPLPAGPGAFQLLQKARDMKSFLSNLQSPNGPLSQLNLACAPLIMDVNATLLGLGVQTGIVAASGGVALPALPALGSLLSLLPIK